MSPIFTQIIIMFLIMGMGFVCGKAKLITPEVNRGFSNLALMVVNPLTTFSSYLRGYSDEVAVNLLHAFLISGAAFAVQILISVLFVSRKNKEFRIERMSVMLSNCSYIGIPLVQSVYGAEGVIYLTAYVTVFNLINWTYGLTVMSGEKDVKKMLRSFINPAIISVCLGMICFFSRIQFTDILRSTIGQVSNVNTPLAMLIAGSTLAHTKMKKALLRPKTYYICALKLLLVPVSVMGVLYLISKLDVSADVVNIVLIACACPTATIVTMFSHRFGKNSVYSSEIFAICTLLSAASLPAVLKIASLIGI